MPHDPHEHDHGHEHGHGHDDHAPIVEQDPDGPCQRLAEAARELLIEKGYFAADDIRRWIERMDGRNETLGAKIVARAWTDPDFKARLLRNGRTAIDETFGVDILAADLVVVENTDDLHNVIVCTLCSCYPLGVLGRPPDWYKAQPYRARVVREPRAVLREFGTLLPDHMEVRVHDSTADMRYLVLPQRPPGTEGWSEEDLATLVTRDTMIGVARIEAPGG